MRPSRFSLSPPVAPASLDAAPLLRRRQLALTLGGVALLTASAQVSLPLAPWGVPFTLQAHMVLALAVGLGRRPAVAAVVAYLTLGALGAPVFAGLSGGALHLMGPRAGYLWSFIATAWWMGGGRQPAALWRWASASMLTLAGGWLGLVPWLGATGAWAAGVAPFWLADLAKATALWLAFAIASASSRQKSAT